MLTLAYFASAPDWLIIGALVFLLFGGQKIPEFARGLGEGLREFKRAMDPSHHPAPVSESAPPEQTTGSPAPQSPTAGAGTSHETEQPNH